MRPNKKVTMYHKTIKDDDVLQGESEQDKVKEYKDRDDDDDDDFTEVTKFCDIGYQCDICEGE